MQNVFVVPLKFSSHNFSLTQYKEQSSVIPIHSCRLQPVNLDWPRPHELSDTSVQVRQSFIPLCVFVCVWVSSSNNESPHGLFSSPLFSMFNRKMTTGLYGYRITKHGCYFGDCQPSCQDCRAWQLGVVLDLFCPSLCSVMASWSLFKYVYRREWRVSWLWGKNCRNKGKMVISGLIGYDSDSEW